MANLNDANDTMYDLNTELNSVFEEMQLIDNISNYYNVTDLPDTIDHSAHQYRALHMNIRSLPGNFDKLNHMVTDFENKKCDIDFLFLCETFLNENNCSLFNIDGYTKVEKHRTNSRGGGVALYLNDKYQFKVRDDLSIFEEGLFESIFVEININEKPLILGEIYRVPNTNVQLFIEKYEQIVLTVLNEKKELLIGSDQNLNLIKAGSDKNVQQFLDVNYANGLLPVIHKPTRITHDTATLIDNFYTTDTATHKSAIILNDISDHLPIFICFGKPNKKQNSKGTVTFTIKDYNENSISKINDELSQINWSTSIGSMNTQDSFDYIINKIQDAVNNHCTVKTVKLANRKIYRNPWMTSGLLKSSDKLNRLHSKSLRSAPGSDRKKTYKAYRKQFNKLKRFAKFKYYHDTIESVKGDTAKLWHTLNRIIGKTNNKKDLPGTFNDNGLLITDHKLIADGFCNFFTNVGKNYASKIPPSVHDFQYYLKGNSNSSSIYFSPTDPEEIVKIIKTLKSKKSCGHDGLSGWLIKKLSHSISQPISIAINKSMESGQVPSSLKLAKVKPIFKAKDASQYENYRPISLLPCISKILEKVVYKRLYNFLNQENILYSSQYGFRQGHSTIQAVSEFMSSILQGLEDKEFTLGLFLDLSKAFDTIDHRILIKKLEFYGVRGLPLLWFRDYLSQRQQFVEYKGIKSKTLNIDCGVPQGSVLGPLLFLIYMNDLPNVLNYAKSILFADDTTIYYQNENPYTLFRIVNNEISKAADWFQANKLSINATKTHYVVFHTKSMELCDTHLSIQLGTQTIQRCDVVKFLGLFIDEHLDWNKHTSLVESKIARSLYIFNSLKNTIPTSSLKTLYYSLIYSNLNYGVIHWSNTFKYNVKSIIKNQIKAVKIVSKPKRGEDIDSMFKRTHILKFDDIPKLELVKLIYDFSHQVLPKPLQELFDTNQLYHSYQTRQATNPMLKDMKKKLSTQVFLPKHLTFGQKYLFKLKNVPQKEALLKE